MEVVLLDFAGRTVGQHIEDFDNSDSRVFATMLRRWIALLESQRDIVRHACFLGIGIGIVATGPVMIDEPEHRMAVKRLRG